MKKYFEWKTTDDEDSFLDRVANFVEGKFGGYSIYHVDGRFRAGKLSTQEEAAQINKSITEQVSGEDEIWVVESGMRYQVNIWKPGK